MDVRRGTTIVDSASVGSNGNFSLDIPLESGRNAFTVEAVNNVGIPSLNSPSVTIYRLAGAFVSIPSRYVPGSGADSQILVALTRMASRVRIELWSLAGDQLAVVEDNGAKEVYSLTWDGRNDNGTTVGGGPVLSRVRIDYADGSREDLSRAFVLVRP